jgi:molybdate transport system regulatory protein
MEKLKPRLKLWFNNDGVNGVFGDGKWRLLKAIEDTESLSAASRSLRISYRKAWGDLKKAQDALDTALVEKQRGGNAGGKTVLTDDGRKWIEAYARFRRDVETAVERAFEKRFEGLLR